MQMNITNIYATEDNKKAYKSLCQHFCKNILMLSPSDVNLSDWLSDFSGSGLTEAMLNDIADQYDMIDKSHMLYTQTKGLYHKMRYQYWEKYIKNQILINYDIQLEGLEIAISDILNQILLSHSCQELIPICNKPFLDSYYLAKESNDLHTLTKEEIHYIVEHTTNCQLYSQCTGKSIEEAKQCISKREEEHFVSYKAYRPSKF